MLNDIAKVFHLLQQKKNGKLYSVKLETNCKNGYTGLSSLPKSLSI